MRPDSNTIRFKTTGTDSATAHQTHQGVHTK